MFGRMKAFAGLVGRKLVEPEAVLFGLVVTWVLVAFVMNGCGGGGGGPQPQPTTQTAHSAASTVARTQKTWSKIMKKSRSRLRLVRSRQNACPTFTSNWDGTGPLPNPYVETYDYGAGCNDDEWGVFLKGKVTFTFNDPEFDEEGDLNVSSFSISFTNFSYEGETLSGTFSLSETSKPMVYRVSYDLRYSNIWGCSERETFNGTIETDDFIDVGEPTQEIWNGTGTYSDPSGNFKFEMTDLLWRLDTPCEYPEGGIMKLTAGGVTMTITFSGVCGRATVAINGGSPQPVELPPLTEDDPYDPCD